MNMDNISDILKTIAGGMSSILVISGFLIWAIKPFRKSVTNWIKNVTHTDASDVRLVSLEKTIEQIAVGIKDIQGNLDAHISQNTEEFKKSSEAQMLSLRCQIRDIYVGNYKDKKLTSRQKRDIHDLFDSYCKLGGNGYILSMFDEMRTWGVEEGL